MLLPSESVSPGIMGMEHDAPGLTSARGPGIFLTGQSDQETSSEPPTPQNPETRAAAVRDAGYSSATATNQTCGNAIPASAPPAGCVVKASASRPVATPRSPPPRESPGQAPHNHSSKGMAQRIRSP